MDKKTGRAATPDIQLSMALQKMLKWLHIVFASVLLGSVLVILTILLYKNGLKNESWLYPLDLIIYKTFNSLVTYSFFLLIFTGLIYGLFTKWDFLKHYWIIVKWLVVVLLFVQVWLFTGPAVSGITALSDGQFAQQNAYGKYLELNKGLIIHTGLMLVAFAVVFFISVFKPWGIRKPNFKIRRKTKLIVSGILILIVLTSVIMMRLNLKHYRQIKIHDSRLSGLADGMYNGQMEMGNFTYVVKVQVRDHTIVDIELEQSRNSLYDWYAGAVIPRILEHQNANVNAITGATTTSKAIMKAVENALVQKVN